MASSDKTAPEFTIVDDEAPGRLRSDVSLVAQNLAFAA